MDRTSTTTGQHGRSNRRKRPTLNAAGLVCVLALLSPLSASAELPPQHRLRWSNLTGVQYNPLGAAHFMRFDYRYRLFDQDSTLLRDSFVGVGSSLELSPVWFRGGLLVRVQPVASLRFETQVLGFQYFGVLGSASTFAGPRDEYDSATRDSIGDDAQAIGGLSVRLSLLLRLKYRGLALRNRTRASYWLTDLGPDRSVFYSAGDDTLRPGKGWVVENVLEGGYFLLSEQLLLGLRYRVVSAIHPGLDDNPNGPYHVLGPLVAWQFSRSAGAVFDRSALLFHAGWYLNHRYRTSPVPYLLVGYYFDGTLWSN